MKLLNQREMRKKILVFPFDLMAHYLRCIELVKKHKNAEILFACSKQYSGFVKAAGYSSFPVDGFDANHVMKCAQKFDFSWLDLKDIDRVLQSQIIAIKQHKPDLVIGDTSPTLKMAAEYCGVEYHSLMNGYLSKYYKYTRKLSRTHYIYPFLSIFHEGIKDGITSIAEDHKFKSVHKPFKTLRKIYKLPNTESYLDELEGDINLICDNEDLFPQHNLPDNYQIIGALDCDHIGANDDMLQNIDPKKPTITVCMGSSGNWNHVKFLNDETFKNYNIITAGDKNRILRGEHIFAKDFLNLDLALEHSKALICHGGNGTIHKGIKHNNLILAYTSHFEQEWNVHGLQRIKKGQFIHNMKPHSIKQLIESYNKI